MTRRIRVLLADDTLIAREGWQRILETADDIEVVGEAIVIEEVVSKNRSLQPDIVLLDLKWGHDTRAGLGAIREIKRGKTNTKVIAVSAYDEFLAEARQCGADGVLRKDFSRDELLAILRAVYDGAATASDRMTRTELEATEYINILSRLRPGTQDARGYEKLMEEVLPFLFRDHLSEFAFQCRHQEGEEIWDVVAFVHSDDPFWVSVRLQHAANQIIFELKNVNVLGSDHILQLADYLGAPQLHLGAVVTRNPPSRGAIRKARSVFEKRGDVILILTDEEIIEMLRVKAHGGEPSDCLRRIYVELIRAA